MRIFSFAAAAMCAVMATTAQAGIKGSALQTISNLTITNVDASRTLTATATIGGTAADIRVGTSQTSATNKASLTTYGVTEEIGSTTIVDIGGGPIIGTNGNGDGVNGGAPGDALVAFEGDAGVTPLNNDFSTPLSGANGVRGDSAYGGAPVDFVDGSLSAITSPAAATTFADFNITTANLTGSASGDVNNTTTISFVANSSVNIEISFDHIVQLSLEDYAPDDQYWGYASAFFEITLTNASNADLFEETYMISTFDSTVNHSASQTLAASLVNGTNYTLVIAQRSEVGFGVVPEPTSMAIFGFMGAGAAVSRRRRRK